MSAKNIFESFSLDELRFHLEENIKVRDCTDERIRSLEKEIYWRLNPETKRP
jgi:hypothetical protein